MPGGSRTIAYDCAAAWPSRHARAWPALVKSAFRPAVAVRGCRGLGKRDMKLNDALPHLEVDPESYEVRADGVLLTCEPARVLPLAQRYSRF